jgi:hypothetical protein
MYDDTTLAEEYKSSSKKKDGEKINRHNIEKNGREKSTEKS